MRSLLAAITVMLVLACCAGPVVKSRKAAGDSMSGVPYCLPRTVLVIDVEVKLDEKGATEFYPTANLSVSAQTVADASCRYILEHNKNDASDDDLKITVGTNGLLTSFSLREHTTGESYSRGGGRKHWWRSRSWQRRKGSSRCSLLPPKGTKETFRDFADDVKSRVEAAVRRVAGKRTVYVALPERYVSLPENYASLLETDVSLLRAYPFPEDPAWELSVSLNDPHATGATAGPDPKTVLKGSVNPTG